MMGQLDLTGINLYFEQRAAEIVSGADHLREFNPTKSFSGIRRARGRLFNSIPFETTHRTTKKMSRSFYLDSCIYIRAVRRIE